MKTAARISLFAALSFVIFVCVASALADELPKRTIENPKPKIVLTVLQGSFAFADTAYTQAVWYKGAKEHNALANPFVRNKGIVYALAGAETVGSAWLGGRMRHSQRWHRIWWLPQTAGMLGHAYALSRTLERQYGSR